MTHAVVRTRFAPSPTGKMHIGNLRSALYEYLVAKSQDGQFILRIEDTDRERLVEGSVETIYATLSQVGLHYDEGPDIGGPCAPYVQSERLARYLPYAQRLVEQGDAYYCFCHKDRLAALAETAENSEHEGETAFGYDRHCRSLTPEESAARLAAGEPYVIRQKMPLSGETTFHDDVYGSITVDHAELEDQILIKSDGFPTYNFANVIDDHEMNITHVVRGSEYLSSTPKYSLLYQAFGWDIPHYIHLPLILGTDGRKLSKRHGATSFEDLVSEGYLSEAIVNYIAFLGWAPGKDTREMFTLAELEEVFRVSGISKSPAVFDYDKLTWYNAQYIRAMDPAGFAAWILPDVQTFLAGRTFDIALIAEILQPRLEKKTDIPAMLDIILAADPLSLDVFRHKRSKLTPELSADVLRRVIDDLTQLPEFDRESVHQCLMDLGPAMELKTGQIMGPVRIALSGRQVTPGGAIELLLILGRSESLQRLQAALDFLQQA